MPLLNKGQVRTAVQQAMDDPSSQRWSNANLDILITMVQDTMFESILDTFQWFTTTNEPQTTDVNGNILITALTKRFYRVQRLQITAGLADIQPKLMTERLPQNCYYVAGPNITTEPVQNAVGLTVTYAYFPTRFTDLANDATALPTEYPEGHESALIYTSAAWAMTKGDAESMAQIGRIADASLDALLMHIERRAPTGILPRIPTIKASILRNPLTAATPQG